MASNLFDRGTFAARIGGDLEIQQELIDLFVDSQPERMEALAAAVGAGDLQAARACAHGLAGAFRNMSMPLLGDCAKRIEEAGRNGDLDTARVAFENLQALFVRALEELASGEPATA